MIQRATQRTPLPVSLKMGFAPIGSTPPQPLTIAMGRGALLSNSPGYTQSLDGATQVSPNALGEI